jgi:hypothetical protein
MERRSWRAIFPVYLFFVLAFPAGMIAVELLPLTEKTICGFRIATGLDCPSCGLTRAFRAMGRLDAAEAFRYNPLGPVIFLGALALWGYAIGMLCTGGRLRLPAWWQRHQVRVTWLALAIFLLAGIGRVCYELRHPPPPVRAAPGLSFSWPGIMRIQNR